MHIVYIQIHESLQVEQINNEKKRTSILVFWKNLFNFKLVCFKISVNFTEYILYI